MTVKSITLMAIALSVFMAASGALAYGPPADTPGYGPGGPGSGIPTDPIFSGGDLSDVEQSAVAYLREEEKLARDVYQALGEVWGVAAFSNIASAEQSHMDAVGSLLDYYGLADPTEGKAAGEFANADLQTLYGQLVEKGSQSLEDAYWVGASIEDLDIFDLESNLGQASNQDVIMVFNNLMSGSENHLRAFDGLLETVGVDYTAQYISDERLEDILNSSWNTGPRF